MPIILNNLTISNYVEETYGNYIKSTSKRITGITPLLQKNFGTEDDGDCVLTSITEILYYKKYKSNLQNIYKEVRDLCTKKYGFKPNGGMYSKYISNVFHDLTGKATSQKQKWMLSFWSTIKKNIDNKNPMALGIQDDGRGVYSTHSTVIIGYALYQYKFKTIKFLIIHDLHRDSDQYIDLQKLSRNSRINYFIN